MCLFSLNLFIVNTNSVVTYPVTKELQILFKATILQLGCQVQMKCFNQKLGQKFAMCF